MEHVLAKTTNGTVRGSTKNDVHAFKGIPYGGSTAGRNRFKPPTKPQSWTDVRDTLRFGASSPQPAGGMGRLLSIIGEGQPEPESEECLFLNVWTPEIGDGRKRPVMFWCHGGGYTMGSGSAAFYNGTNLARRGDVVVVTVNHRLGPLGYLYLGDLAGEEFALSGNVGMLDLVAALEWVRDNIEAFGGDPGNVTIFGESGGGSKVSVLMAMPSAAGLFHKAIVESGPGLRMTPREVGTERAEKLLKALEISPKDIHKLQDIPVEQIFEANAKVNRNGLMGWGPVVDGQALPRHPFDPDAPAISANVPLIIGTNKDEATLFLLGDTEFEALDDAGLHTRVKALAGPATDSLIAAYRRVHAQASPADLFATISSDRMMRLNSITQAERKYAQGAAPVYMYQFTWETPILNGRLKSCHALEIPFVFDTLASAVRFTGDSPERLALAERISGAWLAFAHDNVPIYEGLPTWPVYTPQERATMIFDTECRIENDPGSEERHAWEGTPSSGMGA